MIKIINLGQYISDCEKLFDTSYNKEEINNLINYIEVCIKYNVTSIFKQFVDKNNNKKSVFFNFKIVQTDSIIIKYLSNSGLI